MPVPIAETQDMEPIISAKTVWRIRRWVDHEVSKPTYNSFAFAPACFALTPFVALEFVTHGASPDWLLVLPITFAVAWVGLVIWRGARMAKAGSLKSSRDYDRKGKYLLPPEYADSESTLAARTRKTRGR